MGSYSVAAAAGEATLRPPPHRALGRVRAVAAGVPRVPEVDPEPLVRRANARDRLTNAVRDRLARALRGITIARMCAAPRSSPRRAAAEKASQFPDVESSPGMVEQLAEVVQPLGISQAHDHPVVSNRPVVPLAAKETIRSPRGGR